MTIAASQVADAKSVTPRVTVVATVDYAAGSGESWAELRRMLDAVAAQQTDEPFAVICVESANLRSAMPADLLASDCPVEVRFADGESAYDLVLAAVREVDTEFVATIDGDSVPEPGWLQALLAAIREKPDAGVVCGRTTYGDRGVLTRFLAVLQRAWLDAAPPGEQRYVTNNNAIFRREVLLHYPFTNEVGPFGTGLQGHRMRDAGWRIHFAPEARVVHTHDGLTFERAVRAHSGFVSIRTRQIDNSLPRAWLIRLGYAAIPLIVAARTLRGSALCLRFGQVYGIPWYALPAAPLVAFAVHLLEIPGMVRAFRGRPPPPTPYR